MSESDALTQRGIAGRLTGAAADLCAEVRETVDSTNAQLLLRAEAGAPEGLVLAASSQTNGRGRMGRSFCSPAGTGIYMSLLLRPGRAADALSVTAQAAVAACEAIEAETPARPQIKWVNDILIGGRKVCGILAQAAPRPDGGYIVLGIGINVYAPPGGFPQDVAAVAGWVSDTRREGLRDALAAGFLNSFMRWYREGSEAALADAYARRCALAGRRVRVLRGGEERAALVLGTDMQCRLLVRYDDGGTEALSSGEISIRPGV